MLEGAVGQGVLGGSPGVSAPVASDTANRKNMLLLIQLRWIATIGQLATIAVSEKILDIDLPLMPMAMVLAALVVLNVASYRWLRNRAEVSSRALLLALMLDVAALTAQLYLSGGAANPFTGLYLLQITLGAVLLDVWSACAIAAVAGSGFVALTAFNLPLVLRGGGELGDPFALHILGMLICFALDAALLVVFVFRITRNLRDRDARVAALKQQAAEEDHIVRMGLLASGAAHELGTPLASVAVILSDWRRMPEIRRNAELSQDIDEMQAAVQRCKSIVSGILMSAGEARGEATVITTVDEFLVDVVNEWQTARPAAPLHFVNAFRSDVSIVADSTLEQIVFNLLDNALEASPDYVQLTALRDGQTLVLKVTDHGAGFAPEILEKLGTPYSSTKSRGGGLGLFLVVNVVRKLGGSITARNRPEGGAIVTLTLPLDALQIGARAHGR